MKGVAGTEKRGSRGERTMMRGMIAAERPALVHALTE
jgi:hypothetical protein